MKKNKILTLFLGTLFMMNTFAAEEYLDLSQMSLPKSPNYYLMCPKDFCKNAKPQRIAHVYDVAPLKLLELWKEVIQSQPRVTEVFADPARGQWRYVQRSRILQFPDQITIQFIPVDAESTTLAIFSKSVYGYYDFNVNENRIRDWVTALDLKVNDSSKVKIPQ